MRINNLNKLVLLGITIGILYTMTGCQDYTEPMKFNNENTYGRAELPYTQESIITDDNSDIQKLESALNGHNKGYGREIYENALSGNVNPYLMTVLINFQTVNGTSYGANITNNMFGISERIDFSQNKYGTEILKNFNTKSESILYVVNKLRNTYTREYNLMSIEEIADYLYPEWERFNQFEDTRERYSRIVKMLYRDYEALKGEKYSMRGDN